MPDREAILFELEGSLAAAQEVVHNEQLEPALDMLLSLSAEIIGTTPIFLIPACTPDQDEQHTDIGNDAQYLIALCLAGTGRRSDALAVLQHLKDGYELLRGSERAKSLYGKVVQQLAELS